jgi:hypothetical protein
MTSCEEIIPMCLATDSPIPVVDQQGTLVGEIRREAVADAITSGTNSPGNNLPGNNSMGNSVGTNSPGTPENDLMAAPPEASPDPNI